jgi:hypothetical protein
MHFQMPGLKESPSLSFFWIRLVHFQFNWIFVRHHPVIERIPKSTNEKIRNGAKICHKVIYQSIQLMMHKLTQLSF